jgi:hypothetical protein
MRLKARAYLGKTHRYILTLATYLRKGTTVKRALSIFFQFLLLLIAFFVGGLLPVFHILPLWSIATGPASSFVLDGLFTLIFLYMLFLVVAVLRRRIATSGLNTTIAFLLALVIGLIAKFPFKSV